MADFVVGRRGLLLGGAAGAFWSLASRTFGAVLGYPRALQGPMIGHTGPNHLTVWARVSGQFPVQVEYARQRDFSDAKLTEAQDASLANDLTTVFRIDGLEPATDYY